MLLLEDDPVIAKAVGSDLTAQGSAVCHCNSIAAARKALAEQTFDLLLFDVNLPDGRSFDLCRDVAAEHPGLPILVLTASTDEQTALKSLSIGAVDFIRKPFSRAELLLRIKGHTKNRQGTLQFGELSLSLDAWKAEFAGAAVAGTRKEMEVLALLMRRPGDTVSRETIMQEVDPDGQMADRTLNSHISRLRKKLEETSGGDVRIEPVYGVGYRLVKGKSRKSA